MRSVLLAIGLLVAIVGGIVGVKWAQVSALMKSGAEVQRSGPAPEEVSTQRAQAMRWETTLAAVGSIEAARGVAVSNDLPGVVTKIHFESGDQVKAGQRLVELETSVEQASLRTALTQKRLLEQTVKRTRDIFQSGGMSQSQLDQDEARYAAAVADVESLRAQIERKVVQAPFAGKLGIRAVNLGQYLSPGTTITTLEALDAVFVDFALPQQALPQLRNGLPVHVTVSGTALSVEGSIAAIAPRVDETTRTVQIRAQAENPEQALRPGMFVEVRVVLPDATDVVVVPITAIVRAPYGDSLFVVEQDGAALAAKSATREPGRAPVQRAVQKFVRLGEQRGDFVSVLSGLEAGAEVVSAGAFKLRTGSRVVVNNAVQAQPQLKPRLENR